jgi:hypothetical protein
MVEPQIRYDDGAIYERYMGKWSGLVWRYIGAVAETCSQIVRGLGRVSHCRFRFP